MAPVAIDSLPPIAANPPHFGPPLIEVTYLISLRLLINFYVKSMFHFCFSLLIYLYLCLLLAPHTAL